MAMQHSDQLQAVISVVSEQLQGLGFQFHYVNFVVVRADRGWDCYNAVPNGDILSFLIPYVDHRIFSQSEEVIQQGLDFFTYALNPDENYEWNNYLFNHTILKDAAEEYKQFIMGLPCLVASVVVWPDIALSIARYSGVPFTDIENAIFKRFGAVFGQAYTRFKDLKKAEEQARQAIRTASLDRVRAQIASMRTTQDLERITPLIWTELTTLEVPFFRCGVFIINPDQHRIQAFLSTPDGHSRTQLNLAINESDNNQQLMNSWQQQQVFRDRWTHEQLQHWVASMVEEGQMDSQQEYEVVEEVTDAFSLQFIPFRQGMLYVGSQEPLTDSQLDLTQSLADAFSVAYARYEDFRQLEEAKVRVDATLTELKATQTQLIQKEKLASLGELTAGIAHEIQNPLNFVNNFSEVSAELVDELKEELARGDTGEANAIADDLKQNLQKIHHHGGRAASIVKGMLEHSRTSTGEKQSTNLNALADEYLRLAYQGLRAKAKDFNCELVTDFAADLAPIAVVPQEIGRVLLNLYNNAFYAVHEKQKTAPAGYKPTVMVRTHQANGHVEIRVRDNGAGIPEAIKSKIFQPFFTTKPTGEGTGLGLSLSYDIITKGHGGTLAVKTDSGLFTEFIITLPFA
jgi:signal transduction histidine kinase